MSRVSVFAFLALAGCSVSVGTVPHKPPQIAATVSTKLNTPEFGRMNFNDPLDMDGISMFFWPAELRAPEGEIVPACRFAGPFDSLNESQKMSLKICQVNTHSGAIDREFERLRIETPKIIGAFTKAKCLELSTVPASSIHDSLEWVEVAEGDERAPRIEQCRKWKDDYTALTVEGVGTIAALKTSIVGEIGAENWIEINKGQSSLMIHPHGEVTITMRIGKVVYSTDLSQINGKGAQQIWGASYDCKYRLLKFEMNVLDTKRAPTGSVYKVTLERMEILGMARFTGDVQTVSADGQMQRSGSMQISGHLQ